MTVILDNCHFNGYVSTLVYICFLDISLQINLVMELQCFPYESLQPRFVLTFAVVCRLLAVEYHT